MSKDIPTESPASKRINRSALLLVFSKGLGAELDGLGYIKGPKRSRDLAHDLGLSKMQAWRLLTGLNAPSLDTCLALRGMGVSLDLIYDGLGAVEHKETIAISIEGGIATAIPARSYDDVFSSVAAVLRPDGTYQLQAMLPGETVPAKSVPLRGLSFTTRATIALVEDDAATLDVLTAQMQKSFAVVPFSAGNDLLALKHGLAGFHAFLIDWRLPDVEGEVVVQTIRALSQAPIFLLTGDASASAAIAKALDGVNVHHVAKPADDIILIKRMSTAINDYRMSPASGVTLKPS